MSCSNNSRTERAHNVTKTVVIAGATGCLGRFLVSECNERKWCVIALVRNISKVQDAFPDEVKIVQAQVTQPETLEGVFAEEVHMVVSAVGITRQRDGVTYQDVDYQANQNLLDQAIRAKVPQFCHIHVLGGESMAHLKAIKAKQDFVDSLQQAVTDGRIKNATVVAPNGFFSDMKDFLDMARSGRAYLFGDGQKTINPIHDADLAKATADAVAIQRQRLDVGGPDVFAHEELAKLAFDVLGEPVRITFLWDWVRTSVIGPLPWISPLTVHGPAQFFLTSMGQDMAGERCGEHHLKDHFQQLLQEQNQD